MLTEELGLEPSEALKDLQRAILAHDPSLQPPIQPEAEQVPLADAGAGGPGPFVGRERELRELRRGLDKALVGEGRLFLVSGEPGIGKSRLVEQLARSARERGADVLVGRCWEAGGAPPTGRGYKRCAPTCEIAIPTCSAVSSAEARRTSCSSFPS